MNTKLFQRLIHSTDQLYEVKFVKPENGQLEPIFIGFSILQNAKLRLLTRFCKFFKRFGDFDKFEVFEMDTVSLFLALSGKFFHPKPTVTHQRSTTRVNRISTKRSLDIQKCFFFLCCKSYFCYDGKSKNYKFSTKGLN